MADRLQSTSAASQWHGLFELSGMNSLFLQTIPQHSQVEFMARTAHCHQLDCLTGVPEAVCPAGP